MFCNDPEFDTALESAKAWLQENPLDLKALQYCGIQYAKKNDLHQALHYFKQALSHYPHEVSCHTNLSNVYISLGDIASAMQHSHQALRLQPNHIETYNNLGRLLYKQGRAQEAIAYFEKALRLEPKYWEAHYNLALSLSSLNLMTRAATHYLQVTRLVPTHPIAHFNLGLIYFESLEFSQAKTHLEETLKLDPNNAVAARILGQTYTELGLIAEAILMYQNALTLSPALADVHHNLAILYLREENRTLALQHFQHALSLDPNNDTANHMQQALSGSQNAKTAPAEYIKQLFDQYADHYNEHLKSKLKYEVPGLLRNAVGRCLGPNPKAGRVLDLGCGTGLAGITFRDLALELIGIDLSPNMIAKAKLLDTYEKLQVTNINAYLEQAAALSIDIIIAADVLVYCGALEGLFKEIQRTLVLHGLFAFTIESGDHPSYQLQPTGRFQHSLPYILSLAKQFELTVSIQEPITLRVHHEIPIPGILFVLKS